MPAAATADAASRCMIEGNDEPSGAQLRNSLKRSRCAGPRQEPGPTSLAPGTA
jgi:hypothetical protein